MIEPRLPSAEQDSFELDSGEALHAEAPETFWIPDRQERENVPEGEVVKLIFRIHLDSGRVEVERMWVIVNGRVGQFYSGALDNDPLCTDDLRAGRELFFLPEHIINIGES